MHCYSKRVDSWMNSRIKKKKKMLSIRTKGALSVALINVIADYMRKKKQNEKFDDKEVLGLCQQLITKMCRRVCVSSFLSKRFVGFPLFIHT